MRAGIVGIVLGVVSCAISVVLAGVVAAQTPLVDIFKGQVFLDGQPTPEGLQLMTCVGGCDPPGYEGLQRVTTRADSSYMTLAANPPNSSFSGRQITFWIVNEFGRIQAAETDTFSLNLRRPTVDLHFQGPLPTPPPTPTPTPPPPTPTPTPTPTPFPPAALPIPGDPLVPQLAKVVLYGSIAVLVVGGVGLYWARRRVQ